MPKRPNWFRPAPTPPQSNSPTVPKVASIPTPGATTPGPAPLNPEGYAAIPEEYREEISELQGDRLELAERYLSLAQKLLQPPLEHAPLAIALAAEATWLMYFYPALEEEALQFQLALLTRYTGLTMMAVSVATAQQKMDEAGTPPPWMKAWREEQARKGDKHG